MLSPERVRLFLFWRFFLICYSIPLGPIRYYFFLACACACVCEAAVIARLFLCVCALCANGAFTDMYYDVLFKCILRENECVDRGAKR